MPIGSCFDKFTECEQLGTSELWYCSRCKTHRQVGLRCCDLEAGVTVYSRHNGCCSFFIITPDLSFAVFRNNNFGEPLRIHVLGIFMTAKRIFGPCVCGGSDVGKQDFLWLRHTERGGGTKSATPYRAPKAAPVFGLRWLFRRSLNYERGVSPSPASPRFLCGG